MSSEGMRISSAKRLKGQATSAACNVQLVQSRQPTHVPSKAIQSRLEQYVWLDRYRHAIFPQVPTDHMQVRRCCPVVLRDSGQLVAIQVEMPRAEGCASCSAGPSNFRAAIAVPPSCTCRIAAMQ